MTFENWVANHVSPFRRRLKRINTGQYIPLQMRTRQVYGYLFVGLVVIAFFSWVFYQLNRLDPFVYFLTHDIPLDLVAFLFGAYWAGIHFWMSTPKAKLGYYPAYTIKNWEKDHKIEAVVYEYDEEELREELGDDGSSKWVPTGVLRDVKAVAIFEMNRCGGLADLPFQGNGPVSIAPALQDDIVEEVNQQFLANGYLVDIPGPTKARLSSGVWEGAEYNIPADFHLFLLGNSDDGLGDEFRRWIKQSYNGLTPLCVVMMAWDPIREKGVLGSITPSQHPTNLSKHLADQERYIHYLEERLKMRSKTRQKLDNVEQGGTLVFPEEEL